MIPSEPSGYVKSQPVEEAVAPAFMRGPDMMRNLTSETAKPMKILDNYSSGACHGIVRSATR